MNLVQSLFPQRPQVIRPSNCCRISSGGTVRRILGMLSFACGRNYLILFRLEAAALSCCQMYHVVSLPTLFHRLTARHDRSSVDLSLHPKCDKEPLSKLSDLANRILVLSFFQRRIHRTFSSPWTQWQDQISLQHNQLGKRLMYSTVRLSCR